MPFLDVSEALTEPAFTTLVTVRRRAEIVNSSGLSTLTFTDYPDTVAIVEAGKAELDRDADSQSMPNPINVYTQFRLRGPAPGFQPDLVIWEGDSYVVTQLNDWSIFGAGYVQAQCQSIDSIDTPPGGTG